MKYRIKKKYLKSFTWLILVLFLLLLSFSLYFYKKNFSSIQPVLSVQDIEAKCSNQGRRKTTCYDNSFAEIAKTKPMEEAFALAKQIQIKDSDYAYCHVLGHNIAEAEVRKNPDNWKQVIQRCPSDQCANGCIHGAFQAKFNVENLSDEQIEPLKSEFQSICQMHSSADFSYIGQTACYHALGHLFVYMTQAKMDKSLSLCDEMVANEPNKELIRYCYEGAFMQVFQSLEPEDKSLSQAIRPRSQSEVTSFCDHYQGIAQTACWNQSWPLFFNDLRNEPAFLIEFCSHVDEENRLQCYSPVISIMAVQSKFDFQKMNSYCQGLPKNLQSVCFNVMAGRMVDVDQLLLPKAIQFCQQTPTEYSRGCFGNILHVLELSKPLSEDKKQEVCPLFPKEFQNFCYIGKQAVPL